MTLSILYRGPLGSCNYDCAYCPFAKHRSTEQELADDRAGLARFVDWVTSGAADALEILFTPWGEALVRRWYREALVTLSRAPNVRRVAIQTNLSGKLEWLAEADRETVALWTTFHPTQVSFDRFVSRCRDLDALGVRYSVGIVGKREHRGDAERLRRALPESVYVWVNAYKSEGPGYYGADEVAAFTAVDPLFPINNRRHASLGFSCAAGHRAFTVDGVGEIGRASCRERVCAIV